MLSRLHRFHGHGAVRRAYRQGRPTRGGLFSLHVNRHDKLRQTRVAVVVSRKIHKSAVKRNRIRRRIYEQVRLHIGQITPPAELVFTVYKPEVAEMPAGEIKEAVNDILKRAGL